MDKNKLEMTKIGEKDNNWIEMAKMGEKKTNLEQKLLNRQKIEKRIQ